MSEETDRERRRRLASESFAEHTNRQWRLNLKLMRRLDPDRIVRLATFKHPALDQRWRSEQFNADRGMILIGAEATAPIHFDGLLISIGDRIRGGDIRLNPVWEFIPPRQSFGVAIWSGEHVEAGEVALFGLTGIDWVSAWK